MERLRTPCALRVSPGKGAIDRTVYGTTRLSTQSYYTHHTQQLSKAAVTYDAKAILKAITSLKQKTFGGVRGREVDCILVVPDRPTAASRRARVRPGSIRPTAPPPRCRERFEVSESERPTDRPSCVLTANDALGPLFKAVT